MQNHIFTLLLATAFFAAPLFAQTSAFAPDDKAEIAEFTYVSDRKYNVIHELDGETFIPSMYQQGQGEIKGLNPGQMRVNIFTSSIAITGVQDLGTFQIVSKYPDKVGYIYELMDAKGQAARLKVVVNQDNYVDLVYLYSKSWGEHTFYLAQKKETELAAEKAHFTSKNHYFVRSYNNLIDKTIYPYAVIEDATKTDQPTRIKQTDNVSFSFTDKSVTTPRGTFDIKDANTYAYNLQGYPGVKSVIEVNLKGKPGKLMVYLNFKQQIEVIEIGNARYTLMP